MAEINTELTKATFNALREAVNDNGWKCIYNEDALTVQYGVKSDDLQFDFYVLLDAQRQLVLLTCKLPFSFVPHRRVDGAVETCAINYNLIDGNFAYDFTNGMCHFKMTCCYRESVISPKAFGFMLNYPVAVLEKYYKRLYRIAIGLESAD